MSEYKYESLEALLSDLRKGGLDDLSVEVVVDNRVLVKAYPLLPNGKPIWTDPDHEDDDPEYLLDLGEPKDALVEALTLLGLDADRA